MQGKPVDQEGLSRLTMNLHPSACLENIAAHSVISVRNIDVRPASGRQFTQLRGKSGTHLFLGSLPNDKGRGVRRGGYQRNAKQEAVTFVNVTAAVGADTSQTVDMGGISLEAISECRLGLGCHGLRISRIADRNLTAVPGEAFQPKHIRDEVDGLTGKRGSIGDDTPCVVR